VLVYLGQWFENYRSSVYFWNTFFNSTSYVLSLTKNCLGYIVGDFFTNPSGHPAPGIKQNAIFVANPTIVSYNVSIVKICNTTNSIARFWNKNDFISF
jgi:hypothetical protein